jgi:hypothetical protein
MLSTRANPPDPMNRVDDSSYLAMTADKLCLADDAQQGFGSVLVAQVWESS